MFEIKSFNDLIPNYFCENFFEEEIDLLVYKNQNRPVIIIHDFFKTKQNVRQTMLKILKNLYFLGTTSKKYGKL